MFPIIEPLASGLRWLSLQNSGKKYLNVVRWYNSLSSEYNSLNEVVQGFTPKKAAGNNNGKVKALSRSEIDLPDAELGKVCLRFAPEPSGYLHIGHSKAALLNKYFAEKYKGKLIIRFDDTNPAKESNEFVENLLKDIQTLGIAYDAVTYTSDYFPQLMEPENAFWRHEWEFHGRCSNLPLVQFFHQGLTLAKQHSKTLLPALAKSGISPGSTTSTPAKIRHAIVQGLGVKCQLKCVQRTKGVYWL